MKKAKLNRSLQQTVNMKTGLMNGQKQQIIDIVEEYVGDVVRNVEDGVDWDASDQNQISRQYQDVIGTLTKASALLDQLATTVLEILYDNDDGGQSDGDDTTQEEVKKEICGTREDLNEHNDQPPVKEEAPAEHYQEELPDLVMEKISPSSFSRGTTAQCVKAPSAQSEDKSDILKQRKSPPSVENVAITSTPGTADLPSTSPSFQTISSPFQPFSFSSSSSSTFSHPITSSIVNSQQPRFPWTSSPSNVHSMASPLQPQQLTLMNQYPPPPLVVPNSGHCPPMLGLALNSGISNLHGQPLAYSRQNSIPSLMHLSSTPTHRLLQPALQATGIVTPPPPLPPFIQTPLQSLPLQQTAPMPSITPQPPLQPLHGQPPPISHLSQTQSISFIPSSIQIGGRNDSHLLTHSPYTTPPPPLQPAPTPPLTQTPSYTTTENPQSNRFESDKHSAPIQETCGNSFCSHSADVLNLTENPSQSSTSLNPESAPFSPKSVESECAESMEQSSVSAKDDSYSSLLDELNDLKILNPKSLPFVPKCKAKNISSSSTVRKITGDSQSVSVNRECTSGDVSVAAVKNKPAATISLVPKSSVYHDQNNSAPWDDFSRLIEKFSEMESESGSQSSKGGCRAKRDEEASQKTETSKAAEKKVDRGSILAGTVVELDSPWSFHVQQAGEIDQVVKDIKDYIEGGDGAHGISSLLIKPGMFCLALFPDDGEHYRAKVLELEGERVNVLYVDYGNTCTVSPSQLRPLPTSLAIKPVLAMWCALSGAAPTNRENMWTEEAILYFQQKVCNQTVQIRVVQLASDNNQTSTATPHLVNIVFKMASKSDSQLLSNATAKPADMSRMLIKEKMAKAISLKDQVATLIKQNETSDKKTLTGESLSRLDDLIKLMKSPGPSSVCNRSIDGASSVATGPRKPEPLCFTNVKKSSVPKAMESLKNAPKLTVTEKKKPQKFLDLKGRGKETLGGGGEEEELFPMPEELSEFNLGCLVDKILHELRNEVGKEDSALSSLVGEEDKGSGIMKPGVRNVVKDIDIIPSREKSLQAEDSTGDAVGNQDEDDAGDSELEFSVMVCEILTPNSFFAHAITLEAGLRMVDLENDLTAIMTEPGQSSSAAFDFVPQKFRLCCTQFVKAYNVHCRALVLDIYPEDVLVLAIDYGYYEWQHRSRLRALPAEYADLSPLVLWCSLSYTQPAISRVGGQGRMTVKEGDDSGWTWSDVEKFRQMVWMAGKDNMLDVVTTRSSVDKCLEGSFFLQLETLPVYLLNRKNPGDEICLNHELIHRGLAAVRKPELEAAGDGDEDKNSDDYVMDECGENWDPMAEDFESLRNSYKVDVEDPGVALVGYKDRDVGPGGRRVCVFYNRPEGCYRGDKCGFLHTKIQDGELCFDQVPVLQIDPDQSSLLPSAGTLVGLTVSAVFSPQLFYVTFPWPGLTLERLTSDPSVVQRLTQTETLENLMDSLQSYYNGSHYDGDMTTRASGQALAVKVGGDWLRAKVVDSDPDNDRIQVMCVDFGDVLWVHERNSRELEMRFVHLPPQAVECCLDEVTTLGGEAMAAWIWGQDAVKSFSDLVKDRVLVGHVKHRFASGRILMSLVDTSTPGHELDIGKELVKGFHLKAGLSPPRDEWVSLSGSTKKKTKKVSSDSVGGGGVQYFPG